MTTFIVLFYWASWLLFNILFFLYDSKKGITVRDCIFITLMSLIPILNTIGVLWILDKQDIYDKVIFKRGSK